VRAEFTNYWANASSVLRETAVLFRESTLWLNLFVKGRTL